ncbi:MAG TPA: hypothetical protein VFA41_21355 [Ktedonobacteraceae bacterium]|jgi:hypothetical protein|nr:hypothetical protein [Ktedonobacteraceae bacterium]
MSHPPSHDDEYVVLPVEDDLLHTSLSPFCPDPSCPCHDDADLIEEGAQQVEDGLLTPAEGSCLVAGQQL